MEPVHLWKWKAGEEMTTGFMFQVGDVIVRVKKNASFYLQELVINAIHVCEFTYSVIDLEGDEWQASPLMIENDFTLKGVEENDDSQTSYAS